MYGDGLGRVSELEEFYVEGVWGMSADCRDRGAAAARLVLEGKPEGGTFFVLCSEV